MFLLQNIWVSEIWTGWKISFIEIGWLQPKKCYRIVLRKHISLEEALVFQGVILRKKSKKSAEVETFWGAVLTGGFII